MFGPESLYSPRRSQVKSEAEKFYEEMARAALRNEEAQRQRKAVSRITNNPDAKAEVRRLERKTGVPGPVIEADVGSFKQQVRREQVANAARSPVLGAWLGENAEIASDDVKSLLALTGAADKYKKSVNDFGIKSLHRRYGVKEKSDYSQDSLDESELELSRDQQWQAAQDRYAIRQAKSRGVFGQIKGSLKAGVASAAGGIYGAASSVLGAAGSTDIERVLRNVQGTTEEYAAGTRGRSDSFVADSLYGGVESIPLSVAGVVTGSLAASLGLQASVSYGNSYAEGRNDGLGVGASVLYGSGQGAIEAATNFLPTKGLLEIAGSKGPIGKAIKRFVVGDILGEQVATAAQDLNSWAMLNSDKTFVDYVHERPEAGLRTFLGTLSGAGPQLVVSMGLRKAFADEGRAQQSDGRLNALDEVMNIAADSKARARDPEAFKQFMRDVAGDNETMFVSGDVIAQFNQDYSNDEFWSEYSDEIEQAIASGGEVELPVADVAARLAGKPDWDAIKDHVRVGPDGQSRTEIEQANDMLSSLNLEAVEQIEEQEQAARRDAGPVQKLRDSIRASLMNSGMTPDVAAANTEIVAALFETEASNLGRPITGNEFSDSVNVQRVLPEILSGGKAADRIDMVINAMRLGKDSTVGVGPSLLQFIKQRGGINDVGGDLKSIGLPQSYIRPYNPGQSSFGGLSGAGDYGLDTTLKAAISEGYFPELEGIAEQDGVSDLDVQKLIDAIQKEVGGEKVYSEQREDFMRAGGEELRQILSSRGVDPDQVSDAEIRNEIEAMEREERIAYEQAGQEGAQGRINFMAGEGRAIIEFFAGSNLSTFQHEMAHFWLERFKGNALSSIETDGNAAARSTFADWETVKKWFKDNGYEVKGDVIPEGAHELFARGWERYLMEGKAPKVSLQSVFRKFAAWMRTIYRAVKKLNAPITPEIREVMDRMLATQEEIAFAAEERGLHLMFDDAVDAGMTTQEAKQYAQLGEDARSEAEEELYGKVYRSMRARESKQWKAQRRVVAEEVTQQVDSRPVFKAIAALTEAGGVRLNQEWVRQEYGEDALNLLKSGIIPMYGKYGDNADQIAEMAGFESGDQLVRELMGLEIARREMKAKGDNRSVKRATIEREVAEEMNIRHGDPLNDGSIEREAQAAVMNERQGERLELELRALASKSKGVNRGVTPYAMAQRWARERISSGVVSSVVSGAAQYRYARTASKAARDSMQAFLRGDTDSAFKHKQTEMLHHALAREAAKASEKVDSAVKRMSKFANKRTIKALAQEHLDRIHGLLGEYDFKRVSQKQLDERTAYAEWSKQQEELGYDVIPVDRLPAKQNWSRLTVEDLLALNEVVKSIDHIGRRLQTVRDVRERRLFNEVVGEAIEAASKLKQKPAKAQFGGETRLEMVRGALASGAAILKKMEDVFDYMDSENSNGVFNRVAFAPIVDAQANELAMMNDIVGQLIESMKAVPQTSIKRWVTRRTVNELLDPKTGEPATFLGEELLVMAMNMGNQGNMEKLIGGFGWDKSLGGMENAQKVVLEVLNRELTADDWRYVQEVWDTIDKLWPQIEGLEKRVNGFAPERVVAVPLETKAGQLRGGYFPVVYDPSLELGAGQTGDELMQSRYTRATTRAGSTNERTSFKGPLNLSLGIINRHVAEVVHDITHREAIIDVHKFLSDPRIKSAVEGAMGKEIVDQFRPWLSHIANEWAADSESNSRGDAFLKALRTNATIVGLGYRISTISLQLSGYANSIEVIGSRYVARGVRKMLNPDRSGWDFAFKHSQELSSRMSTMDRDIKDNATRLASKQKGALTAVQRFAFHGIGYMDRVVTVGSWLGAFDKAIDAGMTEEQAIYAADKAIRKSQGSGAAKDLARVQRPTGKNGNFWKLLTMFYSYSSAYLQRQAKLFGDIGRAAAGMDAAAIPDLAARFLWLNIMPLILNAALTGRGPEEDEDEASWFLSNLIASQFQGIPVARDIAGALESGFGFSFTPAEGFGRSVVNFARDIGRVAEGEETKRMTRNFLEVIGYTTGKVPGQLATTTQFFVDVGYGEQDPQTAAEWWEGITKGKVKD